MTTQELIELSLLDALALLDPDEQRAFDAAFAGATPAIQAHVRREQTRLAHIEALLPDVSAPDGLKAVVLDAVRRAMAEEEAVRAAGLVLPAAPSGRVSHWWRAGSIGLATAAMFFIASTVWVWSKHADLRKRIDDDKFLANISARLGSEYVRDVLLGQDTQRVVFSPASPGSVVHAALFHNPDWKNSLLVCEGLADTRGRRFKLAIVDETDSVVRVIAEIDPNAPLTPHEIPPLAGDAERLAIIAPSDVPGQGVLVSRGDLSS